VFLAQQKADLSYLYFVIASDLFGLYTFLEWLMHVSHSSVIFESVAVRYAEEIGLVPL